MSSFFKQHGFSIEQVEYQLREISNQIAFMRTKHPMDIEANQFFEWCLKKHEIIFGLVQYNPRFGWAEIQNEMDRLFRLDRKLTGFQLNLNIVDTEKPNKAIIERNISKL
jgi:hypothetical protein